MVVMPSRGEMAWPLYACCVGLPSSRKIEKATYHQVPFRVLTAEKHPDHDTIAEFLKRHLKSLSGFFPYVVMPSPHGMD